VKAAVKFAEHYHRQMNITVLVDFDNDSVTTSLEVARALGPKLWGVRLDTSEDLIDRSLQDEMDSATPVDLTGVNPRLVEKVRGSLDGAGFPDVRIVASGGFNAQRIRDFEARDVPVDAYGVGSSLIRGQNDFTADVVMLAGRPCAKVGRGYQPNPRLNRVQ
jgi:nicotinate phosphoribosyltransferase